MLRPMLRDERPHWEQSFPKEVWPAFKDFRNFLAVVWDHLGLPAPTRAQYEIAHRLQYGIDTHEWEELCKERAISKKELEQTLRDELMYDSAPRRDIVRCFRAIGKSYITAAFSVWLVMRNPRDEKVLVVSATGSKSKEFVDQVKGILQSMSLVVWLIDGTREKGTRRRDMADKFDVQYASNSQSFSIKAAGITGQITGSRATTLIADDMEIESNSRTEEARGRILHLIRSDFGPIVETEQGTGELIILGTPQTEESVYNVMVEHIGFTCFTIPLEYPSVEKADNYLLKIEETGHIVNILAPYLRALHDAGELEHGASTDTRFNWEDIIAIKSMGRAEFALQYMLDTSLSDAERYPLKQFDLVVFSTNTVKAPLTIQWGKESDKSNVVNIHNLGFSKDFLLRPLFVDHEWREYEGSVLYVDPAGRGADETAWAVVKQLSGTLYVTCLGGFKGEPSEAMRMIAKDAKIHNVNTVSVEPNYGQGMWIAAFAPILNRVWPMGCGIEESEWSSGQKEIRIIDTLEPVMTSHRLVVDESVLQKDAKRAAADEKEYSFLYQLTHITRDRKALKHEDRLEAVAGAVSHFMSAMEISSKDAMVGYLSQELDDWIEDYEEGRKGRFTRGRRRNGAHTEVTRVTI